MKKERASFMAPLTNQHIVCACYAPAQEGTKKKINRLRDVWINFSPCHIRILILSNCTYGGSLGDYSGQVTTCKALTQSLYWFFAWELWKERNAICFRGAVTKCRPYWEQSSEKLSCGRKQAQRT